MTSLDDVNDRYELLEKAISRMSTLSTRMVLCFLGVFIMAGIGVTFHSLHFVAKVAATFLILRMLFDVHDLRQVLTVYSQLRKIH